MRRVFSRDHSLMRLFTTITGSDLEEDGDCVVNGIHNVTSLNLKGDTELCLNPRGFQEVLLLLMMMMMTILLLLPI